MLHSVLKDLCYFYTVYNKHSQIIYSCKPMEVQEVRMLKNNLLNAYARDG